VELARPRDPEKAAALERWLEQVEVAFAGRVLGVDSAIAQHWGRMSAIRPIPAIDALLAATAVSGGLTLVTRNARDMAGLGALLLNPFAARMRRDPLAEDSDS
jgi:predicted nucleic acid-binding protein